MIGNSFAMIKFELVEIRNGNYFAQSLAFGFSVDTSRERYMKTYAEENSQEIVLITCIVDLRMFSVLIDRFSCLLNIVNHLLGCEISNKLFSFFLNDAVLYRTLFTYGYQKSKRSCNSVVCHCF